MDNFMAGYGIALTMALMLLALLIMVLWICMPFAIFGTKPILRELLAEQRKTNKLLQAQADRENEIRSAVAALPRSAHRIDPV